MEGVRKDSSDFPSKEALEHLDALCSSHFFSSSRRSQEFLRYIVQETLQGRANEIKERNIACEVFGRDDHFEPGEHSVVRVKASDVRKRLAEYYTSAPESNIRIELPVGTYIPQIRIAAKTSAPLNLEEDEEHNEEPIDKRINRRRFVWIAGSAATALGLAASIPILRRDALPPKRPTALDLLWKPVFATKLPLIIFLPVMRYRDGPLTEWTGIGPAAALGFAAGFLARHQCTYELRTGSELTYSQLRDSPSLLLGAFNPWMTQITSRLNLRYTARMNTKSGEHDFGERSFIDTQTKQIWKTVKPSDGTYVTTDYGMACRVFDSNTGQVMFLVFGLYTFGTEGAAMLLFKPNLFSELLKKAPADWERKMFQVIVRVSVVGTAISEPEIVASYFW